MFQDSNASILTHAPPRQPAPTHQGLQALPAPRTLALGRDNPEDSLQAVNESNGVGVALNKISRVLVANDGKLRPILCALIYSALAFWLFSADET